MPMVCYCRHLGLPCAKRLVSWPRVSVAVTGTRGGRCARGCFRCATSIATFGVSKISMLWTGMKPIEVYELYTDDTPEVSSSIPIAFLY